MTDAIKDENVLKFAVEYVGKYKPKDGYPTKLDTKVEAIDTKERLESPDRLCKEEQLDADKLKKMIDRYVYTGQEPLPDPDIVDLIIRPLKLAERGPTRKRVLDRIMDFVSTFIRGIVA